MTPIWGPFFVWCVGFVFLFWLWWLIIVLCLFVASFFVCVLFVCLFCGVSCCGAVLWLFMLFVGCYIHCGLLVG